MLKVKFEIDTDPPLKFNVSHRSMIFPGSFSVATMSLPDLFAGKMHALLFREYKGWVKGRDWYDFLWFISQKIPLRMVHLQERMRQLNQLLPHQTLKVERVKEMLENRIQQLEVKAAQEDIQRFIKDSWKITSWSKDYFLKAINQLEYELH